MPEATDHETLRNMICDDLSTITLHAISGMAARAWYSRGSPCPPGVLGNHNRKILKIDEAEPRHNIVRAEKA